MEQEIKESLQRIEAYLSLSSKNILTIDEAALVISRSPKTIRNKLDEIPHYKGPEGIRFSKKELEQWLCQVKHTPFEI